MRPPAHRGGAYAPEGSRNADIGKKHKFTAEHGENAEEVLRQLKKEILNNLSDLRVLCG